MKNLAICIVAFVTLNVSAGEIQPKKFVEYTVPQGKVWALKSVGQADCKGCASHLRVDGGMRIGPNPVMDMYGQLNLTINNKTNGDIYLLSGAKARFTNIAQGLMVLEINE